MINNTYDQESDINSQNPSVPKSISRRYSGFKNPRIVTMPREYGGKDRHSKVWTIKGLKDRRIRLSVPTAVQLYHLQDQLGLSQPSMVIDWLLDVTKEDINKLPPLQMALEDFNQFHYPDHNHLRTKGKEVAEEYKLNSYNYNENRSSNLCLSRFGYHLDTLAYEPQFLSSVSSTATASFYPQYFMHSQLQLLGSSSPHVQVPLSLIDTKAQLLFGINMNSKASSESNDNDGVG